MTKADIAQTLEGASRIIEDVEETTPDPRLAAVRAALDACRAEIDREWEVSA